MVDTNAVVRAQTRYVPTAATEAAKNSALQAVHHLLQPVLGLSVAHRRELL